MPSFQNESHQSYQNEQQFQNAHFKEIIILFEPLSFQKENHLSYQNEETVLSRYSTPISVLV